MSSAKDIVVAATDDLFGDNGLPAVDRWLAPTYIQHHPAVPDGPEGLRGLIAAVGANLRYERCRAIADGDTVALHGLYHGVGPVPMVSFDIFRVDSDGKLAEHWTAQQPQASSTVSGRSEVDGSTEVTDVDLTEANRKLVTAFVETVFLGGTGNPIDYISATQYHQHNPQFADGLAGLGAGLAALAEQGKAPTYTTLHKVVAEGNLVLTVAEGTLGDTPSAFYDLFRIADGKIVEHWDVVFDIPDTLAHNNGLF